MGTPKTLMADEGLAVANQNRKILHGPELLHLVIDSRIPDHDAIAHVDAQGKITSISYATLDQNATELASELQQHIQSSAQQHNVVPVILSQHPTLYTAYLAILKCGAAFCPISPDTPHERIRFIVKDVKATVLLCASADQGYFQEILPRVSCLSADSSRKKVIQTDNIQSAVPESTPSHTAYVMYTSGSTGTPKGVAVSHSAVCQSLIAHDEHIPSFKRFLQFAAPTFDVSVFEIFFTLFRGATIVCCERERMLTDLPGVINQMHADAAELTPSVATTLLRKRSACPKLNLLLTIGEMLTPQVVSEFGGSPTQNSILYAMYGPTEAAIHCTIEPQMKTSSTVHNIGRPLSTVTAMILDEKNSTSTPDVLGIGETGELAIAGQLADGYLNRPEQTKAAFINLRSYGRVYRTGDRAMMTQDGEIRLLGRISDGQVKIRGQRVELGEIEALVSQVAEVGHAAALVVDGLLVVFCSGSSSLHKPAIIKKCADWLPRHMRPGEVVIRTEGLPLLPSGKIDRKLLKKQWADILNDQIEQRSSTANSAISDQLLNICSNTLGTVLKRDTSLRAAGINSLTAIRLASKLRNYFPGLSVSALLEAETIFDLSRLIESSNQPDRIATNCFDLPENWRLICHQAKIFAEAQCSFRHVQEVLPCSSIQLAMLTETSRDIRLNFSEIVLVIDPSYSFEHVFDCFTNIASRNSILRTAFVTTSEPQMPFVQVVRESCCFDHGLDMLHPIRFSKTPTPKEAVIQIHHAMYDGWSWDSIMQELNAMLRGGLPSSRPAYQDMLEASQTMSETQKDHHLNSWINMLDPLEHTSFPALQTSVDDEDRRSQHNTTLSVGRHKLSDFADTMGVSSAAVIHCAFKILLSSLIDSTRVMTGLVVAGREPLIDDVEQIIGPCLSTLPTVLQLERSMSLEQSIRQVYLQHMHCLRHSSVSLAQILAALAQPNAASLFDSIFVWQESLYSGDENLNFVTVAKTCDYLSYALVVETEPQEDQLRLKTTFDTSKISSEQAELLHNQMDRLICLMLNDQNRRLDDIWHDFGAHLLSISNPYPTTSISDSLMITLANLAHTDPKRVAIDQITQFEPDGRAISHEILTYEDLFRLANQMARCLEKAHGFKDKGVVAIKCQKSVKLYTLICGIVQAGLAYTCIDHSTPEYRLAEIMNQAQAKLLILDIPSKGKNRAFDWDEISLEAFARQSEQESSEPFDCQASGSDLAYVVFTSGSTGVPKGVQVTRDNLASNIQHLSRVFPHDERSRLLQSCSTAFDVSVFEIFWTWHCGMTLCSAVNDLLFRDIEGLIDSTGITHLSMTPSVAALVDPLKVPKVEFLVCSGEPMSAKVLNAWVNHGLHQGYGPSETTNICNMRHYQNGRSKINNVGPPFPNTSVFVCSRLVGDQKMHCLKVSDFKILPLGAVGEIWIGGEQVGHGYTNSDLTAKAWLNHPSYGMLYRSGDIGRLLADGSLLLLGRDDDQAKIRGQRVELNEINSCLLQATVVQDVHTMILLDHSDRSKLVSFLVVEGKPHSSQDLISFLFRQLHDKLPAYMIPEALLPVELLPLTRQGKVDKRRLLAIYQDLAPNELARYSANESHADEETVKSDEESKIAAVLADLANVPVSQIMPHSSFFTFGIDSIRAIAFAQRLKAQGVSVDVSSIMKHSSIRRLLASTNRESRQPNENSRYLRAEDHLPASLRSVIADRCQDKMISFNHILPCTPLQEAMLSSSEAEAQLSYQNHLVYQLAVDVATMQEAWRLMMQRHDILRTVFMSTHDMEFPYVQVIFNTVELPWTEPGIAVSQAEDIAPDTLPWALQLRRKENSSPELHLFIHHALYDAEALALLQTEVETFCRGSALGAPHSFCHYLDLMVNIDQTRAKQFWKEKLTGVTPCRLSHLHRPVPKPSIATTIFKKCPISWHALEDFAKRSSTTSVALLQASLARTLSAYYKSHDVCFGTVFSGRATVVSEIQNAVGPCFNTLPTRAIFGRNTTSIDLCQQLQQLNSDLLPFQATPLRSLQRQYSPDGRPLFDILLLFQNSLPDLDSTIWEITHESGQMDFPFILEVLPNAKSDFITVTLHDQVSPGSDFGEQFLDNFLAVLTLTVDKPLDLARELPKLEFDELHARSDYTQDYSNGDSHPRGIVNGHAIHEPKSLTSREIVFATLAELTKRSIEDIDDDSTIFQLGLDSINAIQLSSKLRAAGYHVSMADILDHPRVHDIISISTLKPNEEKTRYRATPILDRFHEEHRQDLLALGLFHSDVEAVWPCTASQSGILSEYSRSDSRLYDNVIEFQLDSTVDIYRLHAALCHVVRMHAMLRTGFTECDSADSPFIMIVYTADSGVTGRIVVEQEGSGVNDITKRTSLLDPPWELLLQRRGDHYRASLRILHALYDANSIQFIMRDIADTYYGKKLCTPPPVAAALEDVLQCNKANIENEDYWAHLSLMAQSTVFPDLNIERNMLSKLYTVRSNVDKSFTKLQERCQIIDVRLSVVCEAAWAQLLAAYTGQKTVTFGTILSGRSFKNPDLNAVAFPCLSALPVIADTACTNSQLLEQLSKHNVMLQRNPHIPLSKIKKSLGVEGQLFDTVLVFQKLDLRSEAPWTIVSEQASAEYTVSMEVIVEDQDVLLQLTCDEKLVPQKHAELLLQQYEMLLWSILDLDFRKDVVTIRLEAQLPPKEPLIATPEQCLHQMVVAQAELVPNNIAVEYVQSIEGNRISKLTWTYAELVSRASQVANLLLLQGVNGNEIVAVCFEKCPEASFALLGVLMAGCAYLAIDPGSPKSRQEFILQDSKCKIILTTKSTAAHLIPSNIKVLSIDQEDIIGPQSTIPPSLARTPTGDDICYCLYTSGTTGTPKGCLINHRSTVQAMLSFSRIFKGHWSSQSRWLQFAAYHFDVSVLEHFWSWSQGICVTVASRDLLFEDLPNTINKLEITHLDLTPSLARLLSPDLTPKLCQGVFIVGGEQVRQDIIDTWGDSGCLYNFYGPSEVTIGCTVHARVKRNVKSTNIGQQWDNVGSYVLKPNSEEVVLVGAVGELCLSGSLVGVGYLNRPELTSEKFVILESTGERIYRTGDLVRMLHDHSFEFLGRIDDQVKLRGQRLEVGEISHVLAQASEAFLDVAAVVTEHPEQEKEHLVAFLAQRKNKMNHVRRPTVLYDSTVIKDIRNVREHAVESLPSYMIPTYFIAIDFLPLTINNKADTKALKALYGNTRLQHIRGWQSLPVEDRLSSTQDIERLRKIVADYLTINEAEIASSSSILQLGIDSISAIGLSRTLRSAGYTEVSVAAILKWPIISDLAQKLNMGERSGHTGLPKSISQAKDHIQKFSLEHRTHICQSLGVKNGDIESIAPCTPLQEGMISNLLKSDVNQSPYLVKFVYKLSDDVDLGRLSNAWDRLYSQVEILRTRFIETTDGYAQVVLKTSTDRKACRLDYGATFISDKPLESIEESYQQWSLGFKTLVSGQPWEVWLTERSEQQIKYMSLFMFHALYDGISMSLLMQNLHELYQTPDSELATRPSFTQALAYGPLLQNDDAPEFWRNILGRVSLLWSEPDRYQRQQTVEIASKEIPFASVRQTCKILAVTPQAIFHAAWLYSLMKLTQTNPTIGIVVSGRSVDFDGIEKIIGPMFNTLPVTVDGPSDDSTLAGLIRQCHEKNVENLPYQHTPISDIRKWLKLDPTAQLFDSLFVFHGMQEAGETANYQWKEIESPPAAEYPLNIEIEESRVDTYKLTIVSKFDRIGTAKVADALEDMCALLVDVEKASEMQLPIVLQSTVASNSSPVQAVSETLGQDQQVNMNSEDARTIRNIVAGLAGVEIEMVGFERPTIFELGLDSVDVLKLAARLKAKGIVIPVSKILQNPSVAGIAQQWSGLRQAKIVNGKTSEEIDDQEGRSILQKCGVKLADVEMVTRVTPMQEGLLLEYEKYYHAIVLKLRNGINIGHFLDAVLRTVIDLPILRTSFLMVDDKSNRPSFLQFVTKARLGGRRDQIEKHLKDTDELHQHIKNRKYSADINNSMPQLSVICLENGAAFLVLEMSHALYDAFSLQLLLDHIHNCYEGARALDQRPSTLFHHVGDIRKAGDDSLARDFWSMQLKNAPPCLFASTNDFPLSLKQKESAISISIIHNTCRQYGITLQSLGLAIWSLVLTYLTGARDVSFGMVVSGRTSAEAQHLIFPTFNTVVFRPRMEPDSDTRQLLQVMQNLSSAIHEHQHFPLLDAQRLATTKSQYLFNTLFTFQRPPDFANPRESLFEPMELDDDDLSPPYAINIEMEQKAGSLNWTVATQAGVMSSTDVDTLLTQLDDVLTFLVRNSGTPIFSQEGEKTSICGLPPIQLSRQPQVQIEQGTHENTNGGDWSPIEYKLRKVFAEASDVNESEVKKSTSLFHLGLDSVSAIRITRMLKDQGLKVPVSAILKGQTVARIAAAIQTDQIILQQSGTVSTSITDQATLEAVRSIVETGGVPRDDIDGIWPATAGQTYTLDLWQASNGRLFYGVFWLEARNCTKEKFDRAWQMLVTRLSMLRTKFINVDRQVFQVVLKSGKTQRSPLQYETTENNGKLLVALRIHHSLYDAVSLDIVMNELESLCNGEVTKTHATKDFGSFIQLTTPVSTETQQRTFWTAYLENAQPMSAPFGTFTSTRAQLFFPNLLSASNLDGIARREGLSIQAIFFAVIARVTAAKRAQAAQEAAVPSTVVIGVYLSNRSLDLEGITELAAPTFNVVPLRVDVSSDTSILEAARQVQGDLQEISKAEHCGVRLRDVFAWTGIRIDCYVNFLKLPGTQLAGDEGNEIKGCGERVLIRHATGISREEAKSIVEQNGVSPFVNGGISNVQNLKWCVPALDVEAKIDANGELAVGLFGPEDMMNGQELKEMMANIKSLLEEIK